MKFVHTADWQIGMKAAHVGGAGARVREQRVMTIEKLIDVAKENAAEFILVGGDTFEDNAVERILVQKVADILASSKLLVFMIPGNHDPFMPGSVWEHPAWKSSDNVQVLTEERPIEVLGGILYPCPIREKHSGKDPTSWIQSSREGAIQIGMAHGTVEGIHQDEPDYPIPRDAATRTGLDYLALGHWHSVATYEGPDGAVCMAYSGTHETTKFGERDSGNVLVVEITSVGTAPTVTPVRTGSLDWEVMEADLRQSGDLSQLLGIIEGIENPERKLLNLRIAGLLAAEERGEMTRIDEILSSRFLYANVDASGVKPSPEDESWLVNLPAGVIRETGARLRELGDPYFTGDRPGWASPEVASRALMELYAMITQGSR